MQTADTGKDQSHETELEGDGDAKCEECKSGHSFTDLLTPLFRRRSNQELLAYLMDISTGKTGQIQVEEPEKVSKQGVDKRESTFRI